MASRTLPGLGLNGFWALGEDGWKVGMDSNLLVLSALVQPRVVDIVNATPGSPTDGQIYYFGDTHPTHSDSVAVRDNGAWTYMAAFEGMEVYNVADDTKYRYNGTTLVALTDTASSLTTETIQDIVGLMIAGTSGITATYNDAGAVESITVDTEYMQDLVAALLAQGSGITITYNDAGGIETIAVDTEAIQDIIGGLLTAASGVNGGIVVTYNDAGNVESIGLASSAFQTLTDAATIAWDMSAGFNAKVTLGGNRTQGVPTNPVEGRTYTLMIIQPSSGGPRTWTPDASMKFGSAGNPTLSTAANKVDMVYLQCYDSATPLFRCTFNKDS